MKKLLNQIKAVKEYNKNAIFTLKDIETFLKQTVELQDYEISSKQINDNACTITIGRHTYSIIDEY